MIYGNINKLESFGIMDQRVLRALEYAKSHDMDSFEKGRYAIDGDALYMNVNGYTTAPADKKKYEAHKAYIDIHYIIKGMERIDVALVSNMRQGEYDPAIDHLPVEGAAEASAIMKEGDFLVCYPEDGHKPGIQVGCAQTYKTAVFKVKIT